MSSSTCDEAATPTGESKRSQGGTMTRSSMPTTFALHMKAEILEANIRKRLKFTGDPWPITYTGIPASSILEKFSTGIDFLYNYVFIFFDVVPTDQKAPFLLIYNRIKKKNGDYIMSISTMVSDNSVLDWYKSAEIPIRCIRSIEETVKYSELPSYSVSGSMIDVLGPGPIGYARCNTCKEIMPCSCPKKEAPPAPKGGNIQHVTSGPAPEIEGLKKVCLTLISEGLA